MKNLSRLVFASLSALFLAAGFARAAERLDPVSVNLPVMIDTGLPCTDCTSACTSCDHGAE